MKFQINEERTDTQLRKIGVQLATSALRIFEQYRRVYGDNDRVLIVLAVAASTLERAIRADETGTLSDLRKKLSDEQVTPCNIASIAAAVGLPRETARRKVNAMIADGLLKRDRRGAISFASGVGEDPALFTMLRRQAGEIARLTTIFSEAGIIEPLENVSLALVKDDKRNAA